MRRAVFGRFSREAALELNVFNEYTYTLETIIQGRAKRNGGDVGANSHEWLFAAFAFGEEHFFLCAAIARYHSANFYYLQAVFLFYVAGQRAL